MTVEAIIELVIKNTVFLFIVQAFFTNKYPIKSPII